MRLVNFDLCTLKRHFDDQSDSRISLETTAFEALLSILESSGFEIVDSDPLRFENNNNPNQRRREFASDVLSRAITYVKHSRGIEARAVQLQTVSIGLLDSLHLASAEHSVCEYFCTTDDVLIKKYLRLNLKMTICNPVNLLEEFTQ